MNKPLIFCAVSTILTACIVTPAAAAPGHKAAMTCQEFLSLDTVQQPKVVYWIEGLKHKGKWHDAVVDTVSTDQVIPIVTEECKSAPQASFWDKLDASWRKFETSVKKRL